MVLCVCRSTQAWARSSVRKHSHIIVHRKLSDAFSSSPHRRRPSMSWCFFVRFEFELTMNGTPNVHRIQSKFYCTSVFCNRFTSTNHPTTTTITARRKQTKAVAGVWQLHGVCICDYQKLSKRHILCDIQILVVSLFDCYLANVCDVHMDGYMQLAAQWQS